jgi:hypothetical protein
LVGRPEKFDDIFRCGGFCEDPDNLAASRRSELSSGFIKELLFNRYLGLRKCQYSGIVAFDDKGLIAVLSEQAKLRRIARRFGQS